VQMRVGGSAEQLQLSLTQQQLGLLHTTWVLCRKRGSCVDAVG
jgi:hypothetical protein